VTYKLGPPTGGNIGRLRDLRPDRLHQAEGTDKRGILLKTGSDNPQPEGEYVFFGCGVSANEQIKGRGRGRPEKDKRAH